MKTLAGLCTVTVAGLIVATPAASQATHVCDRPDRTRVEATACSKAAESATALRQYVWRTRMIHNLNVTDFLRR